MDFSSSQELEFTGIVTRSVNLRGVFLSNLTNGESSFEVVSEEMLAIGSAVRVTGLPDEHLGRLQLKAKETVILQGDEARRALSQTMKNAEKKAVIRNPKLLVSDALTSALLPKLQETARKILSAKALNRFVLLRFHGDADGISGAFALTKICRMHAIQQNSAIYYIGDAMRDLQLLHHEFMPLVVLLDFSSNSESEEGLKLLKAGGAEVIVIDHHPAEAAPKSADVFLSPWSVAQKEDVSKYTAGYLAIEVARFAGIDGVEQLAGISCAGDKSNILEAGEEERDKALVLDYMASFSSFGNSLDFYASVMNKPELFHSMLFQAREKIEQIFETVRRTLHEKEVNGIKIAIIDLEKISRKHEFPSKGKIATRIFESINSEKPLVVLGYGDKSVVFRINGPAVARGISADKIIGELKVTMKDFVDSGGGHARAASLRVREEFAKDIIGEIVKVIGSA